MIHNVVHPPHIQRQNQSYAAAHHPMAGPAPPPPHLNAAQPMSYVPNQQMLNVQSQQKQMQKPSNLSPNLSQKATGSHQSQQQQQQHQQSSHLMPHNQQNYLQNRSNQNYHQPHRPHKNMAHLTHSSRQNYHSNQAAQSSTKSQFQSYNNNRSTSYLPPLLQSSSSVKPYEMTTTEINENLSKTMNSFSHHAKGSRIHQYTTLMSKNDENEHVNPILDYSEEEKRHDTVLKTRENCTNGNNSSPESADQQKNSQTPMCKVNELVRANKLMHQYKVISEKGPAHSRTFTVLLEIGDEKYSGIGHTIKQAQQVAAAEAISHTSYQLPVSRPTRSVSSRPKRGKPENTVTLTPTVELNSLAMKRGIPTNYAVQYPNSYQNQLTLANGTKNRRFGRSIDVTRHRTTEDDPYHVTVTVGQKQYFGTGVTLQAAKHNAAMNALQDLRIESETENNSDESSDDKEKSSGGRAKSAISVVQEVAQKNDLPIRFVVDSESGPAHMKHFIITCTVGEYQASGEGNSKKIAKKKAAEEMAQKLSEKNLLNTKAETVQERRMHRMKGRKQMIQVINPDETTMTATTTLTSTTTALSTSTPADAAAAAGVAGRRKSKTPIKEAVNTSNTSNVSTEEDSVMNPISRLLRLQQITKKPEPVYTLVEERGTPKKKEFVIEVECNGVKAQGCGSNKKIAKRMAAKNLLDTIQVKEEDTTSSGDAKTSKNVRKMLFKEKENVAPATTNTSKPNPQQLAPGLLLMKSPIRSLAKPIVDKVSAEVTTTEAETKVADENVPKSTDSTPSKSEINDDSASKTSASGGIRPVKQLLYLAKLLKFEVQFNDFPKGNHADYLTLVSLTTDPEQIFHGTGKTAEESKDQAALSALKTLSELGLQ